MTQDEINEVMGWPLNTTDADHDSLVYRVNALVQSAVALEREACAKAVEAEAHMFATLAAAKSLSAAIRARGNT